MNRSSWRRAILGMLAIATAGIALAVSTSSAGATRPLVRATLKEGRTYFLRVDSVPKLFRLQLRLTPVTPESEEFARIDDLLASLKQKQPVDRELAAYSEKHADRLEEELSELLTERYDECAILGPDGGR